MIDLMKFCAKPGEGRDYLEKPSSRGDWTYVSNGHILVRVPRVEGVDEHPQYPDCDLLIKPLDWDQPFASLRVNLGKKPKVRKCWRKSVKNWNHHDCDTCDGSKEIEPEQKMVVDIGGVYFSRRYIRLIAGLAGIEMPVKMIVKETGPHRFRFTGGIGLLMPMVRDWVIDPLPLVVPWPPMERAA